MLKFFYKTILVSVLSGSLLLLDFSYKGAMLNSAMAESVKTDKINDTNYMGTLTMTAVGVIAQRLYAYKPTTDIMLAAAGGVIFIAGEVLAYVGLKDVMTGMEEQITRDAAGNVNKEQLESLERLKKSYQEAKKTANTKKMLQMAAAAAFAAAGVTAYTMAAKDIATLTTCTTGVTTALTNINTAVSAKCKALSSSPHTAALGAECSAEVVTCTAAVTTYQQSLMSYEMGRQAAGPSLPGLTKAVTTEGTLQGQLGALKGACPMFTGTASGMLIGACNPLVPNNMIGESGTAVGNIIHGAMNELPKIYRKIYASQRMTGPEMEKLLNSKLPVSTSYLNKILNFFLPEARAELFSAMGIASSAAVSFILATSATIGPSIDMFMLIPQKRAIVWGILAGLTAAATTSTNNVIAQIDANIKKIDDILKSMYTMADGATGTQTVADSTAAAVSTTLKPSLNMAANAVDYEAVDLSKSITGTLPCATGPDGSTCKSLDDSVKDLPSYAGLDTESQLQLSSILKTASGLSGTSTISKGTLTGASKLSAQSNALNAALAKAKAASADKLKATDSKLNLDAESKKLSDSIAAAVTSNLAKSNTTASGMMGSLYGGKSGTASAVSDAAAKKAEADALAAALARAKGGTGAGAVNINSGSADKMDLGLTGVDNGSNGKLSAAEVDSYNQATKSAGNIDDYDIKNDISTDKGANLFELITHRYQQSGYPRLFKLKEATPAAAQSVKN